MMNGGEVEGDVGAGDCDSSTPGCVGCKLENTIKVATMTTTAINQMRKLLRRIPLTKSCLYFITADEIVRTSFELSIARRRGFCQHHSGSRDPE